LADIPKLALSFLLGIDLPFYFATAMSNQIEAKTEEIEAKEKAKAKAKGASNATSLLPPIPRKAEIFWRRWLQATSYKLHGITGI